MSRPEVLRLLNEKRRKQLEKEKEEGTCTKDDPPPSTRRKPPETETFSSPLSRARDRASADLFEYDSRLEELRKSRKEALETATKVADRRVKSSRRATRGLILKRAILQEELREMEREERRGYVAKAESSVKAASEAISNRDIEKAVEVLESATKDLAMLA